MSELIRKINYFFSRQLWRIDTSALTRPRSILVNTVRLVYITFREYRQNELALRAMSLVYTTLLSIIPLLAFSISILKGFGVVDNQLEPLLLKFLSPLGEKGPEITGRIMEFIGKINFGVLGAAGLVMLIYTSISVIQKIEDSMNVIWKVTRGRSFARRFSDYAAALLIGPVLLFAMFVVTATLSSNTIVAKLAEIEPLGTLIVASGKVIPFIFVILVFGFIYYVIPNTKVKSFSALVGGAVAGIAWHITGWIFTVAVASSTKYAAIYSGLAVLIIFMIWLYINWLIVLVGAQVAFCHQNLKFLTLRREVFNLGPKLMEKLSIIVMYRVAYNFYNELDGWTLASLIAETGLPREPVADTVNELMRKNLLVETRDNPPRLVPPRSIEKIRLREIMAAVRTNDRTDFVERKYLSVPAVDEITDRVENAVNEALGDLTLKDLVTRGGKEERREHAAPSPDVFG
ncbi:MAG TPA: YihY/virulence factor BrkB family protein [Thermodesulfobacteriota bacterium]|nr:YihY/virulence factor BrkB family protein [Thermodesulfobacteriota bacterium]